MVVPGYLTSRISADEIVALSSAPAIFDEVPESVETISDEVLKSVETGPDEVLESERASFEEGAESTLTGMEIDAHIREDASRYGVSEDLIAAIIEAESRFDANAVSRRGALGLMQLMPSTATTLGVSDPFDPRENIDAGVRHLRAMMAHFPDNLPLALAAYNAGERAVIRHRGIPPYRETREYVHRILRRVHGNGAKAQYNAAYAVSPLARLVAGETATVRLKVTNTGTVEWSNAGPCAVVLGDRWYRGRTRLVSEALAASLPAPVSPGQTVELRASVSAPRTPGTYTLAWDMRAQCEWFTNLGGALRKEQVEVVAQR